MLTKDNVLPAIRELIAGALAFTIMILFVVLIWRAIDGLPSSPTGGKDFDPLKELLAIVNPIVGVVIGYYFSRATTEARAEKAEQVSQTATQTASDATQRQEKAENEKEEAKDVLKELTAAVQGSTVGASAATGSSGSQQNVDLAMAMKRADRILNRA